MVFQNFNQLKKKSAYDQRVSCYNWTKVQALYKLIDQNTLIFCHPHASCDGRHVVDNVVIGCRLLRKYCGTLKLTINQIGGFIEQIMYEFKWGCLICTKYG